LVQRQRDGELGSAFGPIGDTDGAAVGGHQFGDDGETDTAARSLIG
jgi:hypothetical protein